ncbi:MAG: hypothetical protein HQL63_13605 [Magnetococcales bacterium]|nr:hypothetical protein [Magnetococcales bacterium]
MWILTAFFDGHPSTPRQKSLPAAHLFVFCNNGTPRRFDEAVKAMGQGAEEKAGQAGQESTFVRKLYAIEKSHEKIDDSTQTRHKVRHACEWLSDRQRGVHRLRNRQGVPRFRWCPTLT